MQCPALVSATYIKIKTIEKYMAVCFSCSIFRNVPFNENDKPFVNNFQGSTDGGLFWQIPKVLNNRYRLRPPKLEAD